MMKYNIKHLKQDYQNTEIVGALHVYSLPVQRRVV